MTAAERAFEEWLERSPTTGSVIEVWRAACEWRAKRDALFADVFDERLGTRIRRDAGIE